MLVEEKIRKMYKNRKWENRVTNNIIEFVINFKQTYGEKYLDRILARLNELEEIKNEYNNTRYIASSKKNYIIFFKRINDYMEFKYILEHELFHFIQKENSKFEKIPKMYTDILNSNIDIFLLEEAFVQYFTARINNKIPEYVMIDNNGKEKKYWLNSSYKYIVGMVEELEDKIGKVNLLDMYMDDNCYESEIIKFDNKFGINAFSEYIKNICIGNTNF